MQHERFSWEEFARGVFKLEATAFSTKERGAQVLQKIWKKLEDAELENLLKECRERLEEERAALRIMQQNESPPTPPPVTESVPSAEADESAIGTKGSLSLFVLCA